MACVTMRFTAHVNVSPLTQNKQSQTCKHYKTQNNLPHTISCILKKRPSLGRA